MNMLFNRAEAIFQEEGLFSLIKKTFLFLYIKTISIFLDYGTYYMYEKSLSQNESFNIKPKIIDGIEIKVISTTKMLEELIIRGYSFDIANFKERFKKCPLAFCIFVDQQLIHITFVALNEEQKKEIDRLPFKVYFQNKEACSGASFTEPKFRGKGLLSYIYTYIFPYLAQRGMVKDKFTIEVNNISSQKAHAKFNPTIIGKGHYLKIFWWEFWKEEPVKEEIEDVCQVISDRGIKEQN